MARIGLHATSGVKLKCHRTQRNAVPHLQFMAERVPSPKISINTDRNGKGDVCHDSKVSTLQITLFFLFFVSRKLESDNFLIIEREFYNLKAGSTNV